MPSFRFIFSQILILAACLSCNKLDYTGNSDDLVVEGWINSGQFPYVHVSKTLPVSEKGINTDELIHYFIKYAKVSISDGSREVFLLGMRDKNFFPPYVFTTSEMRGEVGKTYTMKVSYEGKEVSCNSTINKVVPLKEVLYEKVDTGYVISASFDNKVSDGLFYRCFVLTEGVDSYWKPALLGVIDGREKDGEIKFQVNPGQNIFDKRYSGVYKAGAKVRVRFCTMDKAMYDYWMAFENMKDIAANPLIPNSNNLPVIIDGALGYWTGYGTYETLVQLPE